MIRMHYRVNLTPLLTGELARTLTKLTAAHLIADSRDNAKYFSLILGDSLLSVCGVLFRYAGYNHITFSFFSFQDFVRN